LKATWRSETDFVVTSNNANTGSTAAAGAAPVTASTFMNGEQELALAGSFGRVGFGAINNSALGAHGYSQPFGTAIGSGFRATSGATVTQAVRNDNTIQYTSPVLAGGVKVNLINRKAQNTSASSANYNASLGAQQQASVNSLSAMYNAGPLNVIATRDVEDNTSNAGNRGAFTAVAGNYNLGASTMYASMQGQKATNAAGVVQTDRSTITFAAQYVMGVNTFMGSVQRATVNTNGGASVGTTASLLGLGYEYALSKTAAVVARYERIGNDTSGIVSTAGYAAATTTDRTRMGVGLRVGF